MKKMHWGVSETTDQTKRVMECLWVMKIRNSNLGRLIEDADTIKYAWSIFGLAGELHTYDWDF